MEHKTEKKIIKESFSHEGVTVLEALLTYPVIICEDKTAKKLNAFYEGISKNAYDFVKNSLLSDSKSEYEKLEDEKKRFSFRPYQYTLDISLLGQDDEGVSFSLSVSLFRRGKRLYQTRTLHIWDKKHACLRRDEKEKGKKSKKYRQFIDRKDGL
jgi:hypothetical protein